MFLSLILDFLPLLYQDSPMPALPWLSAILVCFLLLFLVMCLGEFNMKIMLFLSFQVDGLRSFLTNLVFWKFIRDIRLQFSIVITILCLDWCVLRYQIWLIIFEGFLVIVDNHTICYLIKYKVDIWSFQVSIQEIMIYNKIGLQIYNNW